MIKTSTVKAMVATLPSTFLAGCFGPSVRNLQTVPTAELAASSVQSFFGDRTMITYDVFHGTQVEYRRPDGRSFFWYPGNGLTIQANWKVGKVAVNSQEICYQYPSNSYNPFLGPKGGNWECQPAWAHTSGMKQVVKGGNCSPRYAARSYCLIMSAAFPSSAIWMASIGLYPSSAIEPR